MGGVYIWHVYTLHISKWNVFIVKYYINASYQACCVNG